jgi:diaminopimelate epimerase
MKEGWRTKHFPVAQAQWLRLSPSLKNTTLTSGKSEINTKGGKLWVNYKKNAHFYSEIWLEGSAEWVFEGSVEI